MAKISGVPSMPRKHHAGDHVYTASTYISHCMEHSISDECLMSVTERELNSILQNSVGRYHGTTVEPRYFFFTVPVPSRSRYYRGTAIP